MNDHEIIKRFCDLSLAISTTCRPDSEISIDGVDLALCHLHEAEIAWSRSVAAQATGE